MYIHTYINLRVLVSEKYIHTYRGIYMIGPLDLRVLTYIHSITDNYSIITSAGQLVNQSIVQQFTRAG